MALKCTKSAQKPVALKCTKSAPPGRRLDNCTTKRLARTHAGVPFVVDYEGRLVPSFSLLPPSCSAAPLPFRFRTSITIAGGHALDGRDDRASRVSVARQPASATVGGEDHGILLPKLRRGALCSSPPSPAAVAREPRCPLASASSPYLQRTRRERCLARRVSFAFSFDSCHKTENRTAVQVTAYKTIFVCSL